MLVGIGLGLLLCVGACCTSAPAADDPAPVQPSQEDTASPSTDNLCTLIEASQYVELPRTMAGNQFDPSGIAVAGQALWLVNDREGRKGTPPEGNGIIRLDLATGTAEHVPIDGFDDKSRKFEGLAWDGVELHAIGNVGSRKRNTFLVSIPIDPATGDPGKARYHDMAAGFGGAIGVGPEPWDHGIKIEALAATGVGQLLVGLRATGDDSVSPGAAKAYRVQLTPAGAPPGPMWFQPVMPLHSLDTGTATGGPDGSYEQARGISGLTEPVGSTPTILGVAAAEYERGEINEFLSNALFRYCPATGEAEVLCTFDGGRKAEGIAIVPPDDGSPPSDLSTVVVLYDNDKKAPGGYRTAAISLPLCPPP